MHTLSKLLHSSDAWADEEKTDVVVRKYLTERAEWLKECFDIGFHTVEVKDIMGNIDQAFELAEPESGQQYTPIVSLCSSCGQPLPCKPKVKLEKFDMSPHQLMDSINNVKLANKLNELTDAINELREEKA